MASIYQNKVLSVLAGRKYETIEIKRHRKELLQNVSGEILEIGIDFGENLDYYPKHISHITAVDSYMRELRKHRIDVTHYYSKVDELPFQDDTFDTIVMTFAMSKIMNLTSSIKEIKRVLKPRGRVLFMDHGLSIKKSNRIVQDIVSPFYEVIAERAVNRDYFTILKNNDFIIANETKNLVNIKPKNIFGTLYTCIALNMK